MLQLKLKKKYDFLAIIKNKHQINTKIDITKAFAECEGLILLVTHRGIEPRTY